MTLGSLNVIQRSTCELYSLHRLKASHAIQQLKACLHQKTCEDVLALLKPTVSL